MKPFHLCIITGLASASSACFGEMPLLDSMIKQTPTLAPALKVFLSLSLISMLPIILISMSSFTRIIIVLSMLRNALGLQQTPPNSILMSIALFLTIFTMMPVITSVYRQAYQPFEQHQISESLALKRAITPLRKFMLHQIREKDLAFIMRLAKEPLPKHSSQVPFYQLLPAFLLSELQTAFEIGFMIFLPFLLIDLIVSGILMTLGMMMMPPMSISLPIKILLFALIDGWQLIVNALVASFHI